MLDNITAQFCDLIFTSVTANGLAAAAAQSHAPLTLTPGNRTVLQYNNDPTVLCLHNPYQPKCRQGNTNWQREVEHYHNNPVYELIWPKPGIGRLSCADFYNHSDNKPLWWQQLRQEARLAMLETDSITSKEDACAVNHNNTNFYISWQPNKVKKYVKWQQNWYRHTPHHGARTLINLCYRNDRRNSIEYNASDYNFNNYFFIINDIFRDCLWHYGEVSANRRHPHKKNGT